MALNSEVLTSDSMRKVVAEEGLEARNLLNWNVIVSDKVSLEVPKTSKKPPTSPRPQSASPKPPATSKHGDSELRSSNRCSSLGRPKTRLRSSSAGRNPDKCVRARYWAFLFENLYRAVDEIYQTCEVDESIVESKEAIMMLENYCKDFQALIQWLNISKNYEVTPPRNRPTSVAWEVRKSLPTKGFIRNFFLDKLGAAGTTARRKLDLQATYLQSTAVQTDSETELSEKCISTDGDTTELNHHRGVSSRDPVVTESKASDADINVSDNNLSKSSDADINVPDNNLSKSSDADISVPDNNMSKSSDADISVPEDNLKKSNETIATKIIIESVDSGPENSGAVNCSPIITNNCQNSDEAATVLLETVGVKVPKFEVEFLGRDELHDDDDENIEPSSMTKNLKMQDCANSISDCNMVLAMPKDNVKDLCTTELGSVTCDGLVDSVLKIESHPPTVNDVSIQECQSFDDKVKITDIQAEKLLTGNKVEKPPSSDSEFTDSNLTQAVNADHIATKSESSAVGTSACHLSKGSQTDCVKVQEVLPIVKKCVKPSVENLQQKRPQHPSSLSKPSKPVITHFTAPAVKNYPTKAAPVRHTNTVTSNVSQFRRAKMDVSARNTDSKMSNAAVSKTLSTEKAMPRTGNSVSDVRRPIHVSSAFVRGNEKPVRQQNTPLLSRHLRPSQHHLGKDLPKSGSSTSLNSNSSVKAKRSNMSLNSDSTLENEEDSDGWETVRGRTRCKNSPAKKIQSNGAYDRAVAAKISQSKIGGFPYTCTSNSQAVQKKPSKPSNAAVKTAKPSAQASNNKASDQEPSPKSSDRVSDQKVVNKKVPKENTKSEVVRKVVKIVSLTQDQNVVKSPKNSTGGISKHSFGAAKTAVSSKVTSNVSQIERQLTVSAISRTSDNLTHSKADLRRIRSSTALEMKKKTDTSKSFNDLPNNSESNKKTLSSSADGNLQKQESVNCAAKPDTALEQAAEIELHVFGRELNICPETAALEKNTVLDSGDVESDKPDLSASVQNVCSSENCDAKCACNSACDLMSHDESNDAQTIEMYEKMIQEEAQEHISELGLSWGDQMDLLDMELRTPGRALQMHEKLSSPFRKRTLAETIRRQEEKQLKAQEQRERFLEEKAQRFKDIQKKVEEMRAFNEKKQEQQRISLEQRLQRAEEKRKKELEKIIRKAHDEEEKVNEIAFINSLEAQNKRHDLISKEKDHEARLQDIQGERQRKLEEKAAKEAAAEERRKVLEAERQARLLEMQEKRKQRDLKIEQQLLEKEKERHEIANQKARERELRISAVNAAQQAAVEELQKKIQMKQEESARRHEENIEQIRQKAFELSVRRYSSNNDDAPQLVPYETKKICTICNVLIGSEVYLLSHLRGKKHQEMISDQHQGHDPSTEELELYNLKHIVDASTDQLDPNIALDKERLKALKKRCKKLRQRMANRGLEFEKSFESNPVSITSARKHKMQKLINEIKKYASCTEKGPWSSSSVSLLERTYTEMEQLFSKCTTLEKADFRSLGGVGIFMDVLMRIAIPVSNNNSLISVKVVVQACKVAQTLFKNCYENSIYVLLSNKIGVALDALIHRLRVLIPDNFSKLVSVSSSAPGFPPVDEVAGELMCFLGIVLDYLAKKKMNDSAFWDAVKKDLPQNPEEEFQLRINDIVSYIVSIGIVDRLSQYINSIRGAVDSEPGVAAFLLHSVSFLMALVKLSSDSYTCLFERKKTEDTTQLLATLKVTDLVGAVSLLYCTLLHGGSPSLGEMPPPQLPEHTVSLTLATLRLLNHAAILNLHVVQSILGSEGLSLQLRHISNYLLWYCKHWKNSDLLHEIIILIGYFTVLNADNQLIIQVGQRPSVLKQLSTLPFQYFSNRQLTDILFPTLISCCFNSDSNKAVLQSEMSIELLSHYIEGYLLDIYNISQVKNDPNIRWRLHSRFPKYKWTAAKLYFAKPTD